MLRIFRELMRDRKNPAKRLEALSKIGRILVPGYRFAWPDPDWCHNGAFNRYLTAFDEMDGYNTHRRWALAQLLRMTAAVEGDTAECGVYRGAASHTILAANARSEFRRHHHVFDSFDGLSAPVNEDGQYWTRGDLTASEQVAREALREFTDKTFYKGWIPDRFPDVAEKRFSFVHVDVDLYQPTKDSIAFFHPRLTPGAIFVCDDYGLKVCPGATKACDDFLSDKMEKMISMPDGAGFFIKGLQTSAEVYQSAP
ncbi:MAG: TylF/MycF/NovP-related O-methyltransferase [Planctomycetaceae bacterium]